VPLGVDRNAVRLVGDDEHEVIDQELEVARSPLPGPVERQPLGPFDDEVGGALEYLADRSGARNHASRNPRRGIGLYPDRHPYAPSVRRVCARQRTAQSPVCTTPVWANQPRSASTAP
jgi:hypothetical protein